MRHSFRCGLWSMFFTQLLSLGSVALGQGSGFTWGGQATTSRYVPDRLYSYVFGTSGEGSVEITRQATGMYQVDFNGITSEAGSYGHVQVTPFGGTHYCQVQSWQTLATKISARVACYDQSGALKDGTYTAMATLPVTSDRSTLFAWANNPSAPTYEPDRNYSHNTSGAVQIRRSAVGAYEVRYVGAASLVQRGGNVQVSGYGPLYAHCKVKNWTPSGSDLLVSVNCYDASGALADRRFVSYMSWGSTYPFFSSYAWGSQATTAQYTAPEHYSSSQTIIKRLDVGSYQVSFPGTDTYQSDSYPTNIQVTSYGATSNLCRVLRWQRANPRVANDKLEVFINCSSPSGVHADQQFSVLAFYPYVIP